MLLQKFDDLLPGHIVDSDLHAKLLSETTTRCSAPVAIAETTAITSVIALRKCFITSRETGTGREAFKPKGRGPTRDRFSSAKGEK
jgi:hypothetical protein